MWGGGGAACGAGCSAGTHDTHAAVGPRRSHRLHVRTHRYTVLCIVHSYTQLYPVILSYSQLKISYTKLYRAALREVTGDTVAATRAATPTPILGR